MREMAPYKRDSIVGWVENVCGDRHRDGSVRTSISAVAPPTKVTKGMRYAVCTALMMLTNTLVEKTERTMILWFEGNFTRHSKRKGRATSMASDTVSAKRKSGRGWLRRGQTYWRLRISPPSSAMGIR